MSRDALRQIQNGTATLQIVNVDSLFFDPSLDARKSIGDIGELSQLISVNGYDSAFPIRVKFHKDRDLNGQCLEITDGRRRFRAAKAAKETGTFDGNVYVILEKHDIKTDEMILRTVTAGQGALPFSDLEQGIYFRKLREFDKKKWTLEKISERVGKSIPFVTMRIDLASLPEKTSEAVRVAITEKKISPTTAMQYAQAVAQEKMKPEELETVLQSVSEVGNETSEKKVKKIKGNDAKKHTGQTLGISSKVFRENMEIVQELAAERKEWHLVAKTLELIYSGQTLGEDMEVEEFVKKSWM
jgi:ParB-like chromosome segregation protein Spo0J